MIPFYILAGGYGKRSQPLSHYKPKAIFPLGGIPLINTILSQLEKLGFSEGYVNLHHMAEEIKHSIKSPLSIRFHHETSLSGNRILKSALPAASDLVLVINGDVFIEIPVARMTELIQESGSDGVLLINETGDPRYSKLRIEGNRFLGISNENASRGWMFSGVALLSKEVIAAINETSMFTTFSNNPFDIRVVFSDSIWLDLGEPRIYYNSNFSYQAYCGIPPGNILSGKVELSTGARVQQSIIWEGCIIQTGAVIEDSIIVQNVCVGAETIRRKIVTPNGNFPLD